MDVRYDSVDSQLRSLSHGISAYTARQVFNHSFLIEMYLEIFNLQYLQKEGMLQFMQKNNCL